LYSYRSQDRNVPTLYFIDAHSCDPLEIEITLAVVLLGAKELTVSQVTQNHSNMLYDLPYNQYDQPAIETVLVS